MENQKYDAHYIKMTEQSVYKLVLKFSGPTVLSMLVTNIYNMVDTEFVGKLGNSASGAVAPTTFFMLMYFRKLPKEDG